MRFSQGDVLLVRVTFSDGSGAKKRPVVIIYDSGDADLLIAPITSQKPRTNRDFAIAKWQQAGLRLPSIIRLEKLATVEESLVFKKMGRLDPGDWESGKAVLRQIFNEILAV